VTDSTLARRAAATDLAIPATDGFALAATEFVPAGASTLTVLVAPATGVKRSLYRAFAAWLSARGLTAVTWDWRGTGGSRPPSLSGFEATMSEHWARRDLAGVIAWAGAHHPDTPLVAVGHSFGGQAFGLAPNAGALRAVVTVAAQSGYWGHYPAPAAWRYVALWYVVMPGLTRLLGYFPARLLGLGEDLPRGVALQWARWCRTPEYLGDFTGHARFAAPLLAYSFDDDPYATARAVDWLHARYGSATKKRRHLAPRDLGVPRIGHLGFFRPDAETLWHETVAWFSRSARPAA
jgi:predicted alpha/beta hydrolase